MTTNPLELIRAEAIPLEPWDDISTQGHGNHGTCQRRWRYSDTQESRRFINIPGEDDPNKKKVKCFTGSPSHEWIRWECRKGSERWPLLWSHPPQPEYRNGWVAEPEGEKCVDVIASAGFVAITQMGQSTLDEIVARYRELRFQVAGVVYISDKDRHGRIKADRAVEAAQIAGLPLIVIEPGELFEGLPKGGSVDDIDPDDLEAAMEKIQAAAQSARATAQATCAEPVELAVPCDPEDSPAQPSAQSELKQVGKGRDQFKLDMLVPKDVAEALEVLTEPLNLDPLSVAMPYLAGLSALIKLGTRIYSAPNYSKPPNLYLILLALTGSAKTDLYEATVKGPAAGILDRQFAFYEASHATWKAKKGDDKGAEPQLVCSQIEDYTAPVMDVQLQANEAQERALAIVSDEAKGIFESARNDTRNGGGRQEVQLLELWDGNAKTTRRIGRATTRFKRCAVSLIGGIQPDVLRELIDPKDANGQWARCLFLQLPDTLIVPSIDGFTQSELKRQEEARLMLSAFAEHVYDLPKAHHQFCRPAQVRFRDWFIDHQHRAKQAGTEPIVRSLLMKSAGQLIRFAGVHHVGMTQGSLDPMSDERIEVCMAVIDQMFAETEAFHTQPRDTLDLAMAKIREIAANPKRAPNGNVSWARNRNHFGRELRDRHRMTAKHFNEAVRLLIDSGQGRLIKNDPVTWHP